MGVRRGVREVSEVGSACTEGPEWGWWVDAYVQHRSRARDIARRPRRRGVNGVEKSVLVGARNGQRISINRSRGDGCALQHIWTYGQHAAWESGGGWVHGCEVR